MKTAFTLLTTTLLALVANAAPAETAINAAAQAQSVPGVCKVCDAFGAGCIAACIAGGPVDPLCDVCAGPAIGTCLSCIAANSN